MKYGIAFVFLCLILVISVVCLCTDKPVQPAVINEVTPAGFIRTVDYYHNTIVFETESGYIKGYNLCSTNPIPVWQGFHGKLHYHWAQNGEWYGGCYALDSVEHMPPDVIGCERK